MRLIFARHAESVVNVTRMISNFPDEEDPLTERGREQAAGLLRALRMQQVNAIYASPLLRARDTAEIVAAGLGLGVEVAGALSEPYCGEIEGRRDDEAWRRHALQTQAWLEGQVDYRLPGGESLRDVQARFVPFVAWVAARHRGEAGCVLMVSHGSVLVNMLPLVLANVGREYAQAHPFGNCEYALAEAKPDGGLICVEWRGEPFPG